MAVLMNDLRVVSEIKYVVQSNKTNKYLSLCLYTHVGNHSKELVVALWAKVILIYCINYSAPIK